MTDMPEPISVAAVTFDAYQRFARTTWQGTHGNRERAVSICCLGAAGEGGELADKWKKVLHYQDGLLTPEDLHQMFKEVGDQVWYLANLCTEFDISFSEVIEMNVHKLRSRQARKKIVGQGDDR